VPVAAALFTRLLVGKTNGAKQTFWTIRLQGCSDLASLWVSMSKHLKIIYSVGFSTCSRM
jgi:hypothetical protein